MLGALALLSQYGRAVMKPITCSCLLAKGESNGMGPEETLALHAGALGALGLKVPACCLLRCGSSASWEVAVLEPRRGEVLAHATPLYSMTYLWASEDHACIRMENDMHVF